MRDQSSTYCIVGGGWFGCYIALLLQERGLDYILVEQHSELFSEASGKNQNRLHEGWHYPRSYATRISSREGSSKFRTRFPNLRCEVENNLHCIGDNSLLDFVTYETIFSAEGYNYTRIELQGFQNVQPFGFLVEEEMIKSNSAKEYFTNTIRNVQYERKIKSLNSNVITDFDERTTKFKHVFNCTYGGLKLRNKYIREEFLTVLLEPKAPYPWGALTVMDGPFFSIYPHESGQYTLTSVLLGPKYGVQAKAGGDRRIYEADIFEEACSYHPSIRDCFYVIDSFLATKYKPSDLSDRRNTVIETEPGVTHVYSGKVDNIFELEDTVESIINSLSV